MTSEQAMDLLDNLVGMVEDNNESDYDTALKMGKDAIVRLDHLIDRPCEACEFHKENGCSRWDCVFEEVKADENR